MQITLKNISHEEKIGKNSGKPFTSCKLTVANKKTGKDDFISGFGNEITRTWSIGDSVDVNLVQTERGYWNFELNEQSKPSPDKKLALLLKINQNVEKLLSLFPSDAKVTQKQAEEIAKDFGGTVTQEQLEEIPF